MTLEPPGHGQQPFPAQAACSCWSSVSLMAGCPGEQCGDSQRDPSPHLLQRSTGKHSESEHRPGRRDEDALQTQRRVNNACLLTTVHRRAGGWLRSTWSPRAPVAGAQHTGDLSSGARSTPGRLLCVPWRLTGTLLHTPLHQRPESMVHCAVCREGASPCCRPPVGRSLCWGHSQPGAICTSGQ